MFCLYTQVSILLIPNTHFNQTEIHLQANAPIAQCIDVTTRSRYPIKSVFFLGISVMICGISRATSFL